MQQFKRPPLASNAESPSALAPLLDRLSEQIDHLPEAERPALSGTLAELRAALAADRRENELRQLLTLSLSGLGVWDLDVQSGQAWRTLRHDQIFGYPELLPEWTYDMFLHHVLPEQRQAVDNTYQAALRGGKPWNFTCSIRRANGEVRWIWAAGQPQFDGSGRVTRFTGLVQDITSLKETELALEASERARLETHERYRTLAEASFEGINISQGGIILEANEQFARMLGYELDEVIGRPVLDFVAPEDRVRVRQAIDSPQELVGEYYNLRKDGALVAVEAHGRTLLRPGRPMRVTVMRDITAQKAAEATRQAADAARQAALEQLHVVLEAAQLGAWSTDVRTGEFTADALALRLHGFAPGELPLTIQEANRTMHPDDRPSCEAAFNKALKETGEYEIEYRVVLPARRNQPANTRWIYSHGALDPTGQRLQGIAMDITARKQAEAELKDYTEELQTQNEALQALTEALQVQSAELEESQKALQESEARLRSVLENSLDASYRRDLRTDRYDYLSPAIQQVLGFTPAEMEAMSIEQVLERIHPEDRQKVTRAIAGLPQSGRSRVVYRWRHPDGRYRWVADTLSTHFSPDGAAIYRSGILRDITEPMEAQEALRQTTRSLQESEERFRLAAAAINEGLWDWDILNARQWWNEAYDRLFGPRPPETALGPEWWEDRLHPDDRQRVVDSLQRALAQEDHWQVEYRFRRPDGAYAWVFDRARISRDAAGRPLRATGAMLDMTELRQSEAALREKEAHLRMAQVAAGIGSWEWDLDTGQVTWSPETYTLMGENPGQPISYELWAGQLDPADRAAARQAVQRCLEQGSAELECLYHPSDPNQPPRWIYTHAAMLSRVSPPGEPAPGGRIMLGIHLDVTERHRAEQNARFLAEIGDLLLGLTDPGEVIERVPRWLGRFLRPDWCTLDEVNLAENTATLYPGCQVEGRDLPEVPPQGLTLPLANFAPEVLMELRQGRTVVVEDSLTDLRTADFYAQIYEPLRLRAFVIIPHLLYDRWVGSLRLISTTPRAWRPDEVGLADSVANLTWLAIHQARTYQDWKATQERFRLALAGKALTVFTQDRQLRYTWAYNPYPTAPKSEEVLGKTDADILSPQAAASVMAIKRQVIETGRPLRRELHYPLGGVDLLFDTMLEPQFDADGQVIGLTGAALDVTEQRRLEKENMEQVTQMEVQHRLLEYREKERQELARDLHDGPIQTLVSAIFNVQFVKEAFENPTLRVELDQIGLAVKDAVGELREMVNELRPPSLIRFGLAKAIQVNAQDFRERHPAISLELELYDDAERLSEQLCLTFYRIYQESLNNIIRHAQATRVMVRLLPGDDQVVLEVHDNGQGFTPPSDMAGQTENGHFGLAGMRERAEAVGGKLEIISAPGKGSIVRVTVPL